jgi:hypothetical protein
LAWVMLIPPGCPPSSSLTFNLQPCLRRTQILRIRARDAWGPALGGLLPQRLGAACK